jgi:S-adenosylmethionine decarboxylase proenzyme
MKWIVVVSLLWGVVLGEDMHEFRGCHLVASFRGCDEEAIKDIPALSEAMLKAVKDCGASVLGFSEYVFPGDGFTMVILLSESHASIHTYPEHKACFVDLFTCGDNCSHELFQEKLSTYLKPTSVEKEIILRK